MSVNTSANSAVHPLTTPPGTPSGPAVWQMLMCTMKDSCTSAVGMDRAPAVGMDSAPAVSLVWGTLCEGGVDNLEAGQRALAFLGERTQH